MMADKNGAPPRAWQRMLSGRRLDLLEPSALDIEIVDIAHGLARVARWNGQTIGDHAFSVAQHSLAVLAIYEHCHPGESARNRLCVLLHDAPEYVIGDMISPFKSVVGGGYKAVEGRLQSAIHLRFGLPAITPVTLKERIKRADHVSAFFEATMLAGFGEPEAAHLFGRPRGVAADVHDFSPWAAGVAQVRFLAAFDALENSARSLDL
ncbi:MAG: HD family hydrolase [Phyllobacteriaceae bacterium]|nr:HD family hydrolase [Phyllobacteriaceae bacterium]